MIGLSAIASIGAELLKLVNLILGHTNDPKMVEAKLNQIHQDLKDKVATAESILADPSKSQEEKDAAFEQIRISDS